NESPAPANRLVSTPTGDLCPPSDGSHSWRRNYPIAATQRLRNSHLRFPPRQLLFSRGLADLGEGCRGVLIDQGAFLILAFSSQLSALSLGRMIRLAILAVGWL